jgi:hypothetical protein
MCSQYKHSWSTYVYPYECEPIVASPIAYSHSYKHSPIVSLSTYVNMSSPIQWISSQSMEHPMYSSMLVYSYP